MKILSSSAAMVCAASVLSVALNGCSGQSMNPTAPLSATAALADGSTAAVKDSASGCPALGNPGDNPGMKFIGVMSPANAVERSSAQITDAWYAEQGLVKEDALAARLAIAISVDKNGDGLLCVAQNWGENLNPNSHWALIYADTLNPPALETWFISDNHVGTSNKG